MENIISIEHEKLGILYGRNCIYADNIIQKGAALTFQGEINGSLTSKIQADIWIPYELKFTKVIQYSSCELDTYELDKNKVQGQSRASFLMIQDSNHLKGIPVRHDYNKHDYKHFLIYTYDYVFNIFAVDYELKCDFSNVRKKSQQNGGVLC